MMKKHRLLLLRLDVYLFMCIVINPLFYGHYVTVFFPWFMNFTGWISQFFPDTIKTACVFIDGSVYFCDEVYPHASGMVLC